MSLHEKFRNSGPLGALLATAVTVAILLTLDSALGSKNDLQQTQAEYCEMVQLGKDSGGKLGWPDYRKAFDSECVKSE